MEWIKPKDKLPPYGERVLVIRLTKHNHRAVDMGMYTDGMWRFPNAKPTTFVFRWASLPEVPEEVEKEWI